MREPQAVTKCTMTNAVLSFLWRWLLRRNTWRKTKIWVITIKVPDTPYKKRGTEWNFVPLALRRLLPDLRAKLACSARSDNALRSGAMLAHESANASLARSWYAMQENSNASAYSVWSDRTFYCIGYSTIIINAARTLLTKACNSAFMFWLRFLFMAELI